MLVSEPTKMAKESLEKKLFDGTAKAISSSGSKMADKGPQCLEWALRNDLCLYNSHEPDERPPQSRESAKLHTAARVKEA